MKLSHCSAKACINAFQFPLVAKYTHCTTLVCTHGRREFDSLKEQSKINIYGSLPRAFSDFKDSSALKLRQYPEGLERLFVLAS